MKTGNQNIKNFEGRDYRIPRTCGGELFCALSDWFSFILPSLLYASLLRKYHHVKHRLPMLCYTESMLHESVQIVINMKIIIKPDSCATLTLCSISLAIFV